LTLEPIPGSRLLAVTSRDSSAQEMRSGELAAAAGVSPDTLRHYERAGLLPAPKRLRNGYRAYSPDTLETVRLIQRALAIGFTLGEIGIFLKERRRGSPPCKRVHALAAERLADTERHIEALTRFRDEFRRILQEWSDRLAGMPDGSAAKLLESLTSHPNLTAVDFRERRFVHRRKSEWRPK
jgi:DNA-binding transcriptional MerR regulator